MSTFWDDVKVKLFKAKEEAGKYAKIALDKTTNAVDITKLNLAKNEAESKISKLYAKIGEVIYGQYKDGAKFEGTIGESLIEIDKFKEEVESLKVQIADLKSTAPCPECGQPNDKASEYCSKCGAKLSEDAVEEENITVDVAEEE